MKNDTLLNITLLINQTASNSFEHFDLTIDQIKKIIEQKETNVDKLIYRSVFQFNESFKWILTTDEKMKFEDILMLNKIIAHKIALEAGVFATKDRFVSTFQNKVIEIKPKDINKANREFNKLLAQLKKSIYDNDKKEKIISFFVNQITEQWFYDGNKRTALLTANKLLLDYVSSNEINLLLNFDNNKFNDLLAKHYQNKYLEKQDDDSKENLCKFLINSINQYQKEELQDISVLIHHQFKSLDNVYEIANETLDKKDKEYTKSEKNVVYKINDIEMEAYDIEDFKASFENDEIDNIEFIEKESDIELLEKCKNILKDLSEKKKKKTMDQRDNLY